jgi:hypothetical protein
MNFSVPALVAGFVFGVIGFYYFKAGKKDGELPVVLIGLTLMVYPYFIENIYLMCLTGFALTGVAYRMRR